MISYAQLCEALAGGGPVHVPIPAPPAPAATLPVAAQALPPTPAAPAEPENTITNLNLTSVDSAADPDELADEVEIGDAEIDSEE